MTRHIRMQRVLSLAVALFAVAILALPGSADAAPRAPLTPQMLGLVATAEATPLQCRDGICIAFFSAFCLEEQRLPPAGGTAYRPTDDSEITLVVETADGRTVRLPAQEYATFKTRLDFTSILARVELSRLAAYQPVRLSIAVGSQVSLLPEFQGAEANTPEIMATVTGPYRRTGGLFFDSGQGRSGAVALVTRMINLMPQQGRLSKTERRTAYATVAKGPAAARFETIIDGCEAMLDRTAERFNMRDCLEYQHIVMQTKTNKEFWKALGGV